MKIKEEIDAFLAALVEFDEDLEEQKIKREEEENEK